MKYNKNNIDAQKAFVFSAGTISIGPLKAFSLMKEMMGGFANVGATAADFKNLNRDFRAYIGGYGSEMILQKFKEKKEISESFFYEYDIDYTDHLTRLFWVDATSRRN